MSTLILFGDISMTLVKNELKIHESDLAKSQKPISVLELDFGAEIHIGDSFIIVVNVGKIYFSNIDMIPLHTEVLIKFFDRDSSNYFYLPFRQINFFPESRQLKLKTYFDDRLIFYGHDGINIYDPNLDTLQNPETYHVGALDAWMLGVLDSAIYYINLKGQLCYIQSDRTEHRLEYDGLFIGDCVKISGGYEHICVLTSNGDVYTFGNSTKGQTGHGHVDLFSQHTYKLECFGVVKIRNVTCGGWHNLVISDNNDLYGWGWNESYQVGMESPKIVADPVSINLRESQNKSHLDVVKIAAGIRHSVAVDTKGNVWIWGSNRFKQVDITDCKKSLPVILLKTDKSFTVNNIWCGRWCTIIQIKSTMTK